MVRVILGLGVVGLLVALAVGTAGGEEAGKGVELFNGKDLTGWTFFTEKGETDAAGTWTVKGGVLMSTGKPAGYLRSKEEYENYSLLVQWRFADKPGNGGVLVHSTDAKALGVWPRSVEVQLHSGDAGDFWVIGTTLTVENEADRKKGRRYLNTSDGDEQKIGEWNEMEITCRGDEVLVKVNGKSVNHGTKLSQKKGAISLQSEGVPMEFRKVRLTPLAK